MKKLLGIVVFSLLFGGNGYANKEIIKYGVTGVNIKTGDLYKSERGTYGLALDDVIKLCRKDAGSRKFCKTWSITHFFSDGSFEIRNDSNQKDNILMDKVLTRKAKKAWWAKRHQLDAELKELLEEVIVRSANNASSSFECAVSGLS